MAGRGGTSVHTYRLGGLAVDDAGHLPENRLIRGGKLLEGAGGTVFWQSLDVTHGLACHS